MSWHNTINNQTPSINSSQLSRSQPTTGSVTPYSVNPLYSRPESGPSGPNKKLDEIRIQVNETTQIMRNNVEQVLERGEQLNNLETRSSILKDSATVFSRQAVKLKRTMWWQNIKFMIIVSCCIIVFILILALIIWSQTK
jgi:vesicle-associated membrane protein 4